MHCFIWGISQHTRPLKISENALNTLVDSLDNHLPKNRINQQVFKLSDMNRYKRHGSFSLKGWGNYTSSIKRF
jgi:hypothetical protein